MCIRDRHIFVKNWLKVIRHLHMCNAFKHLAKNRQYGASFVAYLPFEVSSTAPKSNTIACGYVLVLFVGTSYRQMPGDFVFLALDQFKTNRENRFRSPQSALVHHLPCEPPFRFSYFFGYCFLLSLITILLIMIKIIIIILVGFYGALKEFSMRLQ